jgi:hypothetical protein
VSFRLALCSLAAASLHLHAASGGLRLDSAGSITSSPSEVVGGTRSIKGAYTGTASFTNYLRGDSTTINLQPNQSYRVSFRYKVLVTPDKGFNAFFVSGKGFQQGFSPVNTGFVQAPAGSTGQVSFTEKLQNFDDYTLVFVITGQGAIAVDDIQVASIATGEVVASEDAEPGTTLLSTFFVSASKPVFTWGESVKVTASLLDENNKPIPTGPPTWTVDVPALATIAADGTVTPRAMQTFVVRGSLNGMTGEVRLQPVPKRIVVIPENASMVVGATQQIRADVIDVNDRPIPGMAVNWSVSSLNFRPTSSATIDQAGMLKASGLAKLQVVARINYSAAPPGFTSIAQGEANVEIKLAPTYRFERIFVSKAGDAASSTLAPRPAQLIPTEASGFMFPASLDGLGSALVEWNDGSLQPLLVSGRVSVQSGYPLADFLNYARSPSGEILVQEADVGNGRLLSRGPAAGPIIPVASDGAPIFGAENTWGFDVSRNSLADSGAMLVQVGYTEAVTNRAPPVFFRTVGRATPSWWSRPSNDRWIPPMCPRPFTSRHCQRRNGWFLSWPQFVIWRCRSGEPPRKMIFAGDTMSWDTVRSRRQQLFGTPAMYVASNGDASWRSSTNQGLISFSVSRWDSALRSSVRFRPADSTGTIRRSARDRHEHRRERPGAVPVE